MALNLISFFKKLVKHFTLSENAVHFIGGGEVLPLPYSPEQETQMVGRLSEGDKSIRDNLIEHNLRLVVYIARRFENTGVDLDDLVSVGTIGLIKAVNSFNTEKNIKLATYASRCIENEILMHLRRTVKLKSEVSFEEPLNTDWEGNELMLCDVMGTDGDIVYKKIENGVENELLGIALTKLNDKEREIMRLRYGLGGEKEKTQKEVADMLGISQSYISRLEKKIISRLQKEFSKMV
ncbi:MAG: RNA polymerase sporulation sigma factor SigE [Clostridiales bacterium]|nr:RNA polymerase sporulation sigma factor SigE [Clostridiales bacterium]